MSIRRLLVAALVALPVVAQNPEPGQLDASPALFSVLTAINAAGYDADLDSPTNSPVRAMVRNEVAARKLPIVAELREYFKAHRQPEWTAELSQYVSFALSVSGPPDFKYRFKPHEIPPDVLPLEGFRTLLIRFHREAGVEELWRKAQPAIEEMIARYQKPAIGALLSVNGYLRNTGGGVLGSRFQVYVDVLGAPNQIQTRSYKNEYFVVVTPSAEPQAFDLRHAYLHHLIDPMGVRFAEELNKKKSLFDYAQGAPALEPFYKQDYLLLATESLIKAIESRLAPPAERPAMIEQALSEGFVMTAGFADALAGYEKQEQAFLFYFPALAASIDLHREAQRLDKVQFAEQRAARNAKVVAAERKVEPQGVFKTLERAEQAYANRELDKASETYLQVLRETDERPVQAKAFYGLGRIAALRSDPQLAVRMFEKALETQADDYVKGWCLVYLGRLADAAGERDRAVQNYQAALQVPGAAATAKKAAEKGLQEAFKK